MTDKPEVEASKPEAERKAALSGTAVLLVIGGLILLVAAMASKQWLDAGFGHRDHRNRRRI